MFVPKCPTFQEHTLNLCFRPLSPMLPNPSTQHLSISRGASRDTTQRRACHAGARIATRVAPSATSFIASAHCIRDLQSAITKLPPMWPSPQLSWPGRPCRARAGPSQLARRQHPSVSSGVLPKEAVDRPHANGCPCLTVPLGLGVALV